MALGTSRLVHGVSAISRPPAPCCCWVAATDKTETRLAKHPGVGAQEGAGCVLGSLAQPAHRGPPPVKRSFDLVPLQPPVSPCIPHPWGSLWRQKARTEGESNMQISIFRDSQSSELLTLQAGHNARDTLHENKQSWH